MSEVKLEPGWLMRQMAEMHRPYTAEEYAALDTPEGFPSIYRLMATVAAEREKSAGLEAILEGEPHASNCASRQPCGSCFYGECDKDHRIPVACNCFKSRDPLKVGKAVMAVIRTHQANTGREPSLSCFQRAMDELRDALVSAVTEGK